MTDKDADAFAKMVQQGTGFDPRTGRWEADELRAEVERLRAALQMISDGPPENLRPELRYEWARGVASTFGDPKE